MKAVLIFFLTFSIAHAAAQTVRGTVQDSATATALADATVSILSATDSSVIAFAITNSSGAFEIKNIGAASYILSISHQGFRPLQKAVSINGNAGENLGNLRLARDYATLDEVVVRDVVPVKVRGDTLAFKADAFKTKPDATAEDLLKKLPGMQVDRDGAIKAQGETVQKIYVDGKEFFGNDPALAAKNITADMIEEVELYDDMSEQAKFNKIDDGSRTKAINLKLKKEKRRGTFGQASAGYGTDERYTINGRINAFNGERRVSLFANSNNTNRVGFTSTDLTGITSVGNNSNNNRGGRGGGNGITTSSAAGINYSNAWHNRIELSGNYNGNRSSTYNNRNSYRQNFFPTGTIEDERIVFSNNINNTNRAGAKLTYKVNDRNTIVFTPNLNLQNSQTQNTDSTTSYAVSEKTQRRINRTGSSNRYTGNGLNWNGNLIWRKTFRKEGRTLATTFSNAHARNHLDGFNHSTSTDYDRMSGTALRDSILDQQSNRETANNNTNLSLSYTEPMGRNKVWEVNYSYARNQATSNRQTFDRNPFSKEYDMANEALTNIFKNENTINRVGSNFRVTKKKYNYQAGMAFSKSLLVSNNVSKSSVIRQRFNNLFPTAQFNYQPARGKSFRFNYRGATSQPSVAQLQPIRDVANPRYIREGNPALGQEFRNHISFAYNSFATATLRNLFLSFNVNNTANKIVSSTQVIDSFGRQLIRPVNLNGAYNVSGNATYGFPIKRMEGGNFNTNTTVSYNRDPGLINGQKSFAKNLSLAENLRLNYNYKEKLDLSVNAGLQYTRAVYTVRNQRDDYYTHTYGVDANYLFGRGFILSTDLDFVANTGRSDGFNQSYAIWNAAFAKQLFRSKRGELRASVFDILNNNRSVVRNVGETYIEDVETTVLKRFVMLSFTYKVARAGGRKAQRGERSGSGEWRND